MLAMNKSDLVIDEEPGISLEEQQKIFEPFTDQINILKITKKKAWD